MFKLFLDIKNKRLFYPNQARSCECEIKIHDYPELSITKNLSPTWPSINFNFNFTLFRTRVLCYNINIKKKQERIHMQKTKDNSGL